jgi:hypothetical protein
MTSRAILSSLIELGWRELDGSSLEGKKAYELLSKTADEPMQQHLRAFRKGLAPVLLWVVRDVGRM